MVNRVVKPLKDRGAKKEAPKKMPTALVGRAGLSFVEFHLGRRGFEFIRTPSNSSQGDLWAQTGIGRVSIEVKTTVRGNSWFIHEKQTTSEFYCLTNLEEAYCHVLSHREMQAAIACSATAFPGVYMVFDRSLPLDSFEGWHRLGAERMRDVQRERRSAGYRSTRTVKHILSDGSTKTYVYPGWRAP